VLEDTSDLRQELAHAWNAVITGAIDRGCPSQAVIESMAAVAHERFADLFGPLAAASYLQLLAEQLRNVDQDATVSLVRGASAESQELAQDESTLTEWAMDEPLL
jgi:hypothetical protein